MTARVCSIVGQRVKLRATRRVPRQPAPQAGYQANATRFSTIGNAAEVVGQTPWSARDAPVPLPAQRGQHLAEREQADEGVGRGPGGPPHSMQGTGH